MPEQTGKETQISVTAFAYYKMGQVMADLHAHGLTLPTDELLDLSNYTLTAEGKATQARLAAEFQTAVQEYWAAENHARVYWAEDAVDLADDHPAIRQAVDALKAQVEAAIAERDSDD